MKLPLKIAAQGTLLLAALPTFAATGRETTPLRLFVETKLGVKEEVQVESINADGLLSVLSCQGRPEYGTTRLAIVSSESETHLVPWAAVKEASAVDSGHTVRLVDGTEISGKIATEIEVGSERKFTLSGTKRFVVVTAPKSEGELGRLSPSGSWNLSIAGRSAPIDVTNARFVFIYYSSEGYIMGGSDHTEWTRNFQVTIGSETIAANLPDFESISLNRTDNQDMVTVRAPGSDPVTGKFELTAADSKGRHSAKNWVLVVTLQGGVDIAVFGKSWELVRRKGA